MKNSIKTNLIIVLLVLVVILLVANIGINRKLLKDYINFTENNDEKTSSNNLKEDKFHTNNVNSSKDSKPSIEDFNLRVIYGSEEVSLIYKDDNASFKDEHTGKILTNSETKELFNRSIKDIDFKAPESQLVDVLLYELNLPSDFNQIHLKIQYTNNEILEYNIEN